MCIQNIKYCGEAIESILYPHQTLKNGYLAPPRATTCSQRSVGLQTVGVCYIIDG